MKQIRIVSFLALGLSVALSAHAQVGRATVSDVRVAPLVTSHWNQKSNTGYSDTGVPCYNYYTPEGYAVGCSAASMAQVLHYWRYPQSAKKTTYTCQVNYLSQDLTTLGGDYDWANMPDAPADGVTEEQCAAIGHLTYDCAVSMRSMFAKGGTLAYSSFVFDPFVSYFGYANAVGYMGRQANAKDDPEVRAEDIRATVIASLDYGSPVLMVVLDPELEITHMVVVDGYGYEGKEELFHMNFGLSNRLNEDAWYPLLDATRGDWHFTVIDSIVYNIFPKDKGDVLSGRVLDELGVPVVGATVEAKSGSATVQSVTTDANGIYAFLLPGGKTYTIASGSASRQVELAASVSADVNYDGSVPVFSKPGTLGNSSGNDLVLSSTPPPPPVPGDPLGAFNPKKALSGYPFTGVLRDADDTVRGTVTLKIGKASKKGESRVSGSIALLDGKKFTIKSTVVKTSEEAPGKVTGIVIRKFGTVDLTVGENGFKAEIVREGGQLQTAETADLTGGIAGASATFHLLSELPTTIDEAPVIPLCTPDNEPITIDKRGKWTLRKAPLIKYKKVAKKDESGKRYYEYQLQGFDDPKKPNVSGLKLTFTKLTSTFKGTFYLCCPAGTAKLPKIKKYAVSVTGIVVDGKGVGLATCKKPALSFDIAIY